jgi:hypothetical protein
VVPGEERLEVDLLVDLLLQRLFIVAREPLDDGMHFLLRRPFFSALVM